MKNMKRSKKKIVLYPEVSSIVVLKIWIGENKGTFV